MSTDNSATGLKCPQCSFNIKFTLEEVLHKQKVTCPSCSLELQMNVPRELKEHIQEIVLAEKMVEQAKRFSR